MVSAHAPTVLITGGCGYLGRALIRELSKDEPVFRPAQIRVLDTCPVQDRRADGVTYLTGDVRSSDDVARACDGADLVYHLAALIDWGNCSQELVRDVNLEGTRTVARACSGAGVRGLVFTSSLDAVYAGRPIHAADESLPYPECFANEYCSSKAAAEQVVLMADSPPDGLRTIVIRPCSIWGEGDPYHLGPLLRMARVGPVVRLGRGHAPSQFVYVGNVAHALALAGKALLEGRAEAAGQIYFVTDFPARSFFDQMEPMIRAVGGRVLPQALALPRLPVKAAAQAICIAAKWLRPVHRFAPALTPFAVDYICQEFTVRTDKARRLLGYEPIYSEREAYARAKGALARIESA